MTVETARAGSTLARDTVPDPRPAAASEHASPVEPVSRALLGRLDRLAALGNGPRPETCLFGVARLAHGVKSVSFDEPVVSVVLEGTKIARDGSGSVRFDRGDLLVVTRPCRLDLHHTPDPVTGQYLVLVLRLGRPLLDAATLLWATAAADPLPPLGRVPVLTTPSIAAPLARWAEAIERGHFAEARVALVDLLIGLCRLGHSALLRPRPARLVDQVKALVAAEPVRPWQSGDFERALGLSGATLRRRLAAERTGLREAIAEARLGRALDLLYSSGWPVKTVAARVGYRSAGAFARRFSDRFGVEPSMIGNDRAFRERS